MFLHAMKFAEELEFEILQGYFQFIHVLYNLQFVDNWWFISAWKEGWWRIWDKIKECKLPSQLIGICPHALMR